MYRYATHGDCLIISSCICVVGYISQGQGKPLLYIGYIAINYLFRSIFANLSRVWAIFDLVIGWPSESHQRSFSVFSPQKPSTRKETSPWDSRGLMHAMNEWGPYANSLVFLLMAFSSSFPSLSDISSSLIRILSGKSLFIFDFTCLQKSLTTFFLNDVTWVFHSRHANVII